MTNHISSIHYLDGRIAVFREHNTHHYTPTRSSLKRLCIALRRLATLEFSILPYADGWSATAHRTIYHKYVVQQQRGTVYPSPVEAKVDG